jgi:hypothetical protein
VCIDTGFTDFFTESSCLVCIAELRTLLDLLNNPGRFVENAMVSIIRVGGTAGINTAIAEALHCRLDVVDFDADGSSNILLDTEPLTSRLERID